MLLTKSVLSVQQIQPLVRGTMLDVSVIFAPSAISFASTFTSPMSLTITATL